MTTVRGKLNTGAALSTRHLERLSLQKDLELDFDRGERVSFPMLLLISPRLSFAWKGECFVLAIDN